MTKAYIKVEKKGTGVKVFTLGHHTHTRVFRKDKDPVYDEEGKKPEQKFTAIRIDWTDINDNAITVHTYDDGTAIIDLPRDIKIAIQLETPKKEQ